MLIGPFQTFTRIDPIGANGPDLSLPDLLGAAWQLSHFRYWCRLQHLDRGRFVTRLNLRTHLRCPLSADCYAIACWAVVCRLAMKRD